MTLEVARRLIEDGTASKLAEQQQRLAAERQALALHELGTSALSQKADGFHIWMKLPDGWRADIFVAECRREGVAVSEARSFAMRAEDSPEAIRICISHEASQARLQDGLSLVASVLNRVPNKSLVDL
jgi:DNA-binding transcriptional MocR family regulator